MTYTVEKYERIVHFTRESRTKEGEGCIFTSKSWALVLVTLENVLFQESSSKYTSPPLNVTSTGTTAVAKEVCVVGGADGLADGATDSKAEGVVLGVPDGTTEG